ncbi:MAG: glycosyltransferase [Lachnospiraceae bacterium]|nr:glycosyltransferase [Lachnospiraceae bacterium]
MTKQKDLISIIVPVYNMERYLERCMNSIWQQTYTNLEIILVDDGSTDQSPQMCDDYARKDNRIKVVHKQNGGLSDARNAGLAIASGAYIGYVDSDDWIEPDMYERMYQACVEHDAQVAVCRYAQVYKDHVVQGGNGKVTAFEREELLRIYIGGDDDYVIYNSVWSKLFAREVVEGVQFPKGRNSEDIMYTTKAFCKADRGVYIDTCLYDYVLDRDGSIMNVKRGERMFQDELPFWREHIAFIREHVSEKMGDFAAYHYYRRLLFYYIDWKNETKQARGDYAKRIAQELKCNRKEIQRIYSNDFVSAGDRARMKLALASPSLYSCVTKGYEKVIIPLRSRG